ncbi:hypothetical protein H4Q26_007354 [Puccinia striiformis f. sp. tritici PST-130]|nr:hypothetical protein H4Q26_007354 [Puccinia striiformis f. sp. tritici PST-130]
MSSGWKLGKKLKEATNSLKQTPPPSSDAVTAVQGGQTSNEVVSVASKPSVIIKPSENRAGTGGTLSITIIEAEGLSVPSGIDLPDIVQRAVVENPQVGSLTVGSLAESQPTNGDRKANREGIHRKYNWWLPYLVLEFDKNEVLVEALGGTIDFPVWMYKADFDVSRASEITLSTYLRTSPHGSEKTDMGDDIFLGGLKFQPSFDTQSLIDAWHEANTGNGTGRFHLQVAFKPSKNTQLTIESFELLQVIGKGSFGKVMQVRKKDTGRIYAMKTIRKAHIVSRSEVTHTLAERTVLGQVNNPFIVPLKFSFQNSEKLYLVLSCINGGELFHHLQKEGRFSEERSRLYAAELLCALEHLHAYDVIYRDLKPENILLDYTGHIALCDFGLCKLNMSESEKTNTFCGTPEYLSPELLLGQGYSKSVDWWTLGVLIYEMLSGLPPYYDENVNEMYRKILYNPLPSVASAIDTSNFDSEFTSEAPMDSVVEDSHLSETVQQQFIGFTYNPTGNYMGGESVR